MKCPPIEATPILKMFRRDSKCENRQQCESRTFQAIRQTWAEIVSTELMKECPSIETGTIPRFAQTREFTAGIKGQTGKIRALLETEFGYCFN
jgi:hypothetical protein